MYHIKKNLVTHDNDVKTTWYDMAWHDDSKMSTMYSTHYDIKKKNKNC
jgi:hypothetical protein